jgi:hypothetical protein
MSSWRCFPFVDSTPRAYRLKASNAAPLISTLVGTFPRTDQTIDSDANRFAEAMVRAGLDPTLHLNGVEMINALSDWYDGFINTVMAAAELGLTRDDMVSASRDSGRKFRSLMVRLDQGVVPREEFEGRLQN